MIGRRLSLGQVIQTSAVNQEDVLPSVIVKVNKCSAAAGGLEKVAILVFVSVNGLVSYAGLFGYVDELNSDVDCSSGQSRNSCGNKNNAENQSDHTRFGLSQASHRCSLPALLKFPPFGTSMKQDSRLHHAFNRIRY